MDQRLPGMTGSETTQAIRREFPDARILVLSTYVCDEEIYKALQSGAMAYLSKSVQREELIERDPEGGERAGATSRPKSRRCWPTGCRGRTCRRASWRCCGCWSAASGTARLRRALDITEGTVKLHVSSILGKLGRRRPDRGGDAWPSSAGIVQLENVDEAIRRTDMSFDISDSTPLQPT